MRTLHNEVDKIVKAINESTEDLTMQGQTKVDVDGGTYLIEVKPPHLNKAGGRNNYSTASLRRIYEGYHPRVLENMTLTGEFPLDIVTYFLPSGEERMVQLNVREPMLEELLTDEELQELVKDGLMKIQNMRGEVKT